MYWPSTTKYQPLPPSTDPLPSYFNQYHSILTQYHQVSTSTNLYCCCLGIRDFCTVYPGSCYLFLHHLIALSSGCSVFLKISLKNGLVDTRSTLLSIPTDQSQISQVFFWSQIVKTRVYHLWELFPLQTEFLRDEVTSQKRSWTSGVFHSVLL